MKSRKKPRNHKKNNVGGLKIPDGSVTLADGETYTLADSEFPLSAVPYGSIITAHEIDGVVYVPLSAVGAHLADVSVYEEALATEFIIQAEVSFYVVDGANDPHDISKELYSAISVTEYRFYAGRFYQFEVGDPLGWDFHVDNYTGDIYVNHALNEETI